MSLLPNEWIENSIEVYNYQHTTKSQAIYWVVLAAVTAALISLNFFGTGISSTVCLGKSNDPVDQAPYSAATGSEKLQNSETNLTSDESINTQLTK